MGFEKRIEPRRLWDKPTIVLVDENSFSDGEIFPNSLQRAEAGQGGWLSLQRSSDRYQPLLSDRRI